MGVTTLSLMVLETVCEIMGKENQNLGELADENLGHLTNLEELINDLEDESLLPDWRIREAREHLEAAQDNTVETVDRIEETFGPI